MDQKINITIKQLGTLLNQQKHKTIDALLSQTSVYNPESTHGHLKSLKIDKEKFEDVGMRASFPNDYEVLLKYIDP